MDCRHDGQAMWTGSGPTAGAAFVRVKFGYISARNFEHGLKTLFADMLSIF